MISRNIIDGNQIRISDIQISAVGIIPEKAVLKAVRISKKTEKDEAVARLDCVSLDYQNFFTIKIEAEKGVAQANELKQALEKSEKPLVLELPVAKIVIRPYEISYGYAKVSIISPSVQLSQM